MNKALGILLILASLGGVAYLYYDTGFLDGLRQDEPVIDPALPFKNLSKSFPMNVLILMASIGAFLYSFRWFTARKAPKLPPVRKTGDPEADRRARKRRETAMAVNVRPSPRMPGALLMNAYFMLSACVVLGVAASTPDNTAAIGLIGLVLALQFAVAILFGLFALVWEKSLFKMQSLLAMLVYLSVAGGVALSFVRHWSPPVQ